MALRQPFIAAPTASRKAVAAVAPRRAAEVRKTRIAPRAGSFDHLTFYEPKAVAAKLKEGATLIDVRRPDEIENVSVPGAKYIEFSRLDVQEELDQFISEVIKPISETAGTSGIVVTCGQSKHRGPTAACKISSRLAELGIEVPTAVLRGGVEAFSQQQPDLVRMGSAKEAKP